MATHNLKQLLPDILKRVKNKGMDQADIAAHIQTGFEVSARQGEVETLEHHQEQSITLSVYQKKRSASVSSSDLSKEAIDSLIEKACTMVQFTEPDDYAGLADKADMAFDYPDLKLNHPWKITPEEAIQKAIECETLSRNLDPRISDSSDGSSISTYETEVVYANTHDFVGAYSYTNHSINCSVIADENGLKERDYEFSYASSHDQLWSVEDIAKKAVEKTLKRLGSRQIKTQKCPVIFAPSMAKGFWKHFLSAISGGALYRKSSFLLNHLNKLVFPEHIHIYQDPHIPGMLGSAPFDGEGVKTEKRYFVKDGVLSSYILGSYSARRLGMRTTGNAGGVHNLFVASGEKNLPTLLKEMGTGLLVTELMGQGINILTGNYSRGAFGYWVENGEIQFPVSEITIAGNLKDMFKHVVAVANDIDHRTNIKTGSVLIEQMSIAGS